MNVLNKVVRTAEDFETLLDLAIEGPVAMVHLLKFKARAAYADGRETELTGAEAYGLYRRKMVERVAAAGGRLVFAGIAKHLVLGQVEDLWDEVLVVEFPSTETFVEVISSPEMAEWGVHRRAGLAGQLLIATTAQA